MPHVVLLGDSIFDNAAYVPPRTSVLDHLRIALPADWQATLCARDGSLIDDVHAQLGRIPADATHLILSAGGNDLLGELAVLGQSARTVGEGLRRLAVIQERFRRDYERLLHAIERLALVTVVCTIYEPCFPDPGLESEATTALGLFNDVIVQLAHRCRLPVIELRAVCTEDGDYATPIEPSDAGGAKIAHVIASVVQRQDIGARLTMVLP